MPTQPNKLSPLAKITLFFLVPFLMGTAIDLYVPSMPSIVGYFHTQAHMVQLTIALYMLGYGIGQLVLGVLSDASGRKKILLGGAVCFTLASLAASHAPSVDALILYRFLEGIGMAGMGVMCRIIAVDCYQDAALVKVMTYGTSSWALGPVIGPFIGAHLQHDFGWQSNFYYFAIFGFVILLITSFSLQETLLHKQVLRLKTVATTLKTIATHSGFLLTALMATLIYASLVVFNVVGPFLIQGTLHYSVIDYGHIALVLGAGVFCGSMLNRVLLHTHEPMRIFAVGVGVLIVMAVVSLVVSYWMPLNLYSTLVPMFLLLLVCGCLMPNIVSRTLSVFPELAGAAGALFGLISAGGIFVMTSLATLLHTDTQRPLLYFYGATFIIVAVLFILFKRRYLSHHDRSTP
jgi:DHA1 family bicyclomycin/chloramphenicol resistance-like MFS transporter